VFGNEKTIKASKSIKCFTHCFTYFWSQIQHVTMPSIKLIARKDKARTNGELPLYLRIISDRKPKYRALGLTVQAQHWDEQKERVKKSHPHSVRFNHLLGQKMNEVSEALIETETTPELATDVFEYLKSKNTGLLEFAGQFLSRREKVNKLGMIKRMRTVVAKISEYLNDKDINLKQIDVRWLNRYETHLIQVLGNSTNTVASNMSGLRTILNEAAREGLIPNGTNPFDDYRIRKRETNIEYLTEDELEAFENVSLTTGTRIEAHRDLYVFACYAAGIRIGDLLQLQRKDFDGERLLFRTSKTDEQLSIKLGKTALSVIEHFPVPESPNDFLFGLLPQGLDLHNEAAVLRAITSTNAYINKNIAIVAKKAGITKRVHFHTSRHTWATRALRKGMRIEHVSKLLGHRSIKTTQIYAKIVNADLDAAMDKFND
jgi:integrase/recombinase XerD